MSSSKSTNDCARQYVEARQRDAYRALAIQLPDASPIPSDRNLLLNYLKSDPEYQETAEAVVRDMALDTLYMPERFDIGRVATVMDAILLEKIVDSVKSAIKDSVSSSDMDKICFGTIIGGSLSAFAEKAPNEDRYAIFFPRSAFTLLNLVCKMVALVNPITQTPKGLAYQSTAPFEVVSRASHPYIKFRQRDLLRSFFALGDPNAALPYPMAVPYQDRIGYLLTGTEIYMVAHEIAHVVLGHLEGDEMDVSPKIEMEADTFALDVLIRHFNSTMDHGHARAALCRAVFQSVNKMWETSLKYFFQVGESEFLGTRHPTWKTRMQHFEIPVDHVRNKEESEVPPFWFQIIHNAIGLTIEGMSDDEALSGLLAQSNGVQGLSALSLGPFAHHGHLNPASPFDWTRTIAKLVLSDVTSERQLGLWFLYHLGPSAAIHFYGAAFQEDEEDVRELCRNAILFIEPRYESYWNRLLERVRQEEEKDMSSQYKQRLGQYLSFSAGLKLGPECRDVDPMQWDSWN